MIDNSNYATDPRLRPIHIVNKEIRNKYIITGRIVIHCFHKVIIHEGSNITVVGIIGHTETNNTHPEANTITDKRDRINKITVTGASIGADLLEEKCSPTAGRLEMTKEILEPDKELKEQLLTQDIQKLIQEMADVGHAQMKSHTFRDSAGQRQ